MMAKRFEQKIRSGNFN